MQSTDKLLMIRPVHSAFNIETAENNFFQKQMNEEQDVLTAKAQKEFDDFVQVLQNAGIQVFVFDDVKENNTPDAVFPNNWISFHSNGDIALYPMFAESRRRERRMDVLDALEEQGFKFNKVYDYTEAESEGLFLEGTGSLILDRINKKAYCALSPRADEDLFIEFCEDFEYMPIAFKAFQTVNHQRLPIYHTNVMMCVGTDIAIICLDSIDKTSDKKLVTNSLKDDGKILVKITEQQMESFAGNMLEVCNKKGEKFLVMSSQAYSSLTASQIKTIQQHLKILHSPIETIETLGGGSARCMIAEIFN
jgi:hypothetical protein